MPAHTLMAPREYSERSYCTIGPSIPRHGSKCIYSSHSSRTRVSALSKQLQIHPQVLFVHTSLPFSFPLYAVYASDATYLRLSSLPRLGCCSICGSPFYRVRRQANASCDRSVLPPKSSPPAPTSVSIWTAKGADFHVLVPPVPPPQSDSGQGKQHNVHLREDIPLLISWSTLGRPYQYRYPVAVSMEHIHTNEAES